MELFFIRLTDNKKAYLHPSGKNGDGDMQYLVVEKLEGAALWKEKEGKAFIKYSGYGNMELVNQKDVLS